MKNFRKFIGAIVMMTLVFLPMSQAWAQAKKVQFWHAMGGNLGKTIERITDDYNKSQSNYHIDAVYKGGYNDTYNSGIAAFRTGKPPHILQVLSWGAGQFLSTKGVIVPVSEIMEMGGKVFDQSVYNPGIAAYYSDSNGKLLSLPWNSSTPILFYNKAAFEAAGLDPGNPPGTWEEMYWMSKRIVDRGAAKCGFTVGWQFWVLENSGAWHNVELSTNGNGFENIDSKLAVNKPFFIEMVQAWADWQKEGVFKYGGRQSKPNMLFNSGECAMYIQSSAGYASIKRANTFGIENLGQTFLPYWASKVKQPQNSIIGGGTLFVFSGHDNEEYKGVADYFSHLSKAEVQKDWHVETGYIPITNAAYELARAEGHYKNNPGTDIAIKQVGFNTPTRHSRGHRMATLLQIGDILNSELENVWSGNKTAEQALNDAVSQANEMNHRFVMGLKN